MRYTAATILALSVSLGACGGSPREERAQQVEAAAENKAEAIIENAEGAPPEVQQEAEFNATLTRQAGEVRAKALRDSEGKTPDTAQ